jgi:hypothetical protein
MNVERRDKLIGGSLYVALIVACLALSVFFSR